MKRLAALLGLVGLSCSLMIAGESAPLHCSQEGQSGPPACDAGQVCRAGICQSGAGASLSGGETGGETDGEAGQSGDLASGGAGGAA